MQLSSAFSPPSHNHVFHSEYCLMQPFTQFWEHHASVGVSCLVPLIVLDVSEEVLSSLLLKGRMF